MALFGGREEGGGIAAVFGSYLEQDVILAKVVLEHLRGICAKLSASLFFGI
jgi:hypothetical protein